MADGKVYFLKGTHPAEKAHGVKIIQQEYTFLTHHPSLTPFTAKIHGLVTDDDPEGWTLMVMDYLPKKTPLPPWDDDLYHEVTTAIHHYQNLFTTNQARLSFSPIIHHNIWGPLLRGEVLNWQKIFSTPPLTQGLLSLFADESAGDHWLTTLKPHLLANEQKQTTLTPDGLMHGDLRSDNFIITADGVKIIDWPDGIFGLKDLDLVSFIHGVSAEWLKPPHALYLRHHQADASQLTQLKIINTMLAGLYARQAWRPVPEPLPRLRWMQKMQLYPALYWLSELHALPKPPIFKEMTKCY
jgi:aminoglycoside phosphotransferase (APT) family kinase protein